MGTRWQRLSFPFSSLLNTTEPPKSCSTNSKRALKAGKVDWLETTVLEETTVWWVLGFSFIIYYPQRWVPETQNLQQAGFQKSVLSCQRRGEAQQRSFWEPQPSSKTWAGTWQLLSSESPAHQSLPHDPDRQVGWSFSSSGPSEDFCLPALHPAA